MQFKLHCCGVVYVCVVVFRTLFSMVSAHIARVVSMIGICWRDVVVSSSRCMLVFVFVYLLLFRITRSVGTFVCF